MEKGKKILVVDDEKLTLVLLNKYLTNQGFTVTTSESAFESIQILKKESFDIIITDLNMPDINGFELLIWIKQNLPESLVIIMTAFGSPESRKIYNKYGILKFIKKPVHLDNLKSVIVNSQQEGFRGNIGNLNLFDFVQVINFSQGKKLIQVKNSMSEQEGKLYFSNGELIHAETDDFIGEEAFFKIMAIEKGSFSQIDWVEPGVQTVSMPCNALLIESARVIDEERNKAQSPVISKLKPIKKIMIVDDDETLTKVMEKYLSAQGFEIKTSDSAKSAVEALHDEKFDLVITDLHMPEISGVQLLLWIKKNMPEIQVILMTSDGSEEVKNFTTKNRALKYLEKPVNLPELKDLILKYSKPGFSADISHINLFDFIQIIVFSRNTILINVHSTISDYEGNLYFKSGEIIHAEIDDLVGEEAFYKLMAIEKGLFMEKEWHEPQEKTIKISYNSLLIRAARKIDEIKSIKPEIDANLLKQIENKIEIKAKTPPKADTPAPVQQIPSAPAAGPVIPAAPANNTTHFQNSFRNFIFKNAPSSPKAEQESVPEIEDNLTPDKIIKYLIPVLNKNGEHASKDLGTPLAIYQFLKRIDNKATLEFIYKNHYKDISLTDFIKKFISSKQYFYLQKSSDFPNIDINLKIGQILIFLGFINKQQLDKALVAQDPRNAPVSNQTVSFSIKRANLMLGQLLIEQGAVNSDILNQSLSFQRTYNELINLIN